MHGAAVKIRRGGRVALGWGYMTDNIPSVQAVAETFQSHYGLIVTAAFRFAPTPELVYDIVHQTFVEFMETAMKGHWDTTRDPAPFLYRITKNTAVNFWRREKLHSTETMCAIGEILMRSSANDEDDFESLNERLDALNHCLAELPPKSREVIEQHYLHDVTLESLARRLAMPSNSLRKTVFRLRLKLRDCITRYLNKPISDAAPTS